MADLSLHERTSSYRPACRLKIGTRDGAVEAIEIRRRFDIPSLIVSAFDDAQLRSRLAAARPVGILRKPVVSNVIVDIIRRLLTGAPS